MAAYFGQANLENFLGTATVLALFDDNNTGVVNTTALNDIAAQASARLDGKLARVYSGPFPIAQTPLPENIVHAALLYGKYFAYQRRPEYVKQYGDRPLKEANEFAQELCEATELMADYLGQPLPQNVGTIVNNAGPRLIIDGTDGSYSGGDF